MLGWEFPPFMAGGLGVHCYHLTQALAKQGTEVEFYMPAIAGAGPHPGTERHEHLRIHEVAAIAGSDPYGRSTEPYGGDFNESVMKYNARLVDSFNVADADLIHCHDWITVPAALELKKRTGLPLVFTVHSTEHDRSGGFGMQDWIVDIERDGVRHADRVIAVSRYTKDLLERLYGADPAKVAAIHNGIDPSGFEGETPAKGREDGTVLFLSRLARQKGPLHFLAAAKKVLEIRPQTGFVIAGKGDMLGECIDYTLQNGIADRVRFMGYVPDDERTTTYRQNQVYVLPSVSEPFGISALEAMAAGTPTIVSRNSGISEAVQHVLRVDHEDVDHMAEMILQILSSPALGAELSRNGRQEARRFDWDTCARQTIHTYRSCLTKPPSIELTQ